MNEHFIVVSSLDIYPYLKQTKGFPVHGVNYTDVTPPPPQKKKKKKKKKNRYN